MHEYIYRRNCYERITGNWIVLPCIINVNYWPISGHYEISVQIFDRPPLLRSRARARARDVADASS